MNKATVHPDYKDKMRMVEVIDEPVVIDHNVITGQGLGVTIPFALKLIECLTDASQADKISKAICFED